MTYKQEYPDGINESFWNSFVVPQVKRIKGNKCEMCLSNKNLDLHHTDYKDEISLRTLKVLCKSCHKFVHYSGTKNLIKIRRLIDKGKGDTEISKLLNIPRLRIFRFRKKSCRP